MEFGSHDGGDDAEYNDYEFVEISKILATQDTTYLFDGVYQNYYTQMTCHNGQTKWCSVAQTT